MGQLSLRRMLPKPWRWTWTCFPFRASGSEKKVFDLDVFAFVPSEKGRGLCFWSIESGLFLPNFDLSVQMLCFLGRLEPNYCLVCLGAKFWPFCGFGS